MITFDAAFRLTSATYASSAYPSQAVVACDTVTVHGNHTKLFDRLRLLDRSDRDHIALQRLDLVDHLFDIHFEVNWSASTPQSALGEAAGFASHENVTRAQRDMAHWSSEEQPESCRAG